MIDPGNRFTEWSATVHINENELPGNRPSIIFHLTADCMICGLRHHHHSTSYSLIERERASSPGSIRYEMTIHETNDSGDIVRTKRPRWAPCPQTGSVIRSFYSGSWRCSSCGVVWGLSEAEANQIISDAINLAQVVWIEEEIKRLEPYADGQTVMIDKRRFWKFIPES